MMTTLSSNTAKASSGGDPSLRVHIATKLWEKREIYRLRYEVYVQEMALPLGSLANKRKQLTDAMDNQSILLYVQSEDRIIATSRLTIAAAEDYPPALASVFHLNKFKTLLSNQPDPKFGLGTKLAVNIQYRNSTALFLLVAETDRILREQNVSFFFGGCKPNLISLYERIGFRRFTSDFSDFGYGLLVPLVAVLEDIQHFQLVRSPLYRHIRKYPHNSTIAPKFLQVFPETSKCLNTQLVSPETLSKYIEDKLAVSPPNIPIFKYLEKEIVTEFLHLGAVFSCTAGNCLVYKDSLCEDLYLLLSGALTLESAKESRVLKPGEYFGNLAEPVRSSESVSALTDSELIVIPRQAFERYQRQHHEASEKILNNIKQGEMNNE